MTERRIILEMGTGNDLYGEDYTKAACRAVQDALHHSSIVMFKSLGYDNREMRVQVTIGVQDPDRVDAEAVAAELPRGRPEVKVVHGGLNVHDPDNDTTHVVASAAISAFLPIEDGAWRLSEPAV
ncbi:Lin0512 family protein [Halomonas aquatica]|uniref:Lin0512 family protein n=1 Tax=Halomonas aquatica TaxID=3151123 RepID=A0ABV1NCJ6_9GAMM